MDNIKKDEYLIALGALFREARLRRGWSQVELAERIGITQVHYSYIERGKRDADFMIVLKLCKLLGVDIAAFISKYI